MPKNSFIRIISGRPASEMQDKDPDTWLENRKEEIENGELDISWEEWEAWSEFREEADIQDSTIYPTLSRMKTVLLRFTPPKFDINNPTEADKKYIIEQAKDADIGTKDSLKSVMSFYREYKGGEHHHVFSDIDLDAYRDKKDVNLEPWMILAPSHIEEITGQMGLDRNRAWCRMQYCTGGTPGEVMNVRVCDVNLEKATVFLRGVRDHRDGTAQLDHECVRLLRQYLKGHPAVDDVNHLTADAPLWVKKHSVRCEYCGNTKSAHEREPQNTCSEYRPGEIEDIGYRALYKKFKQACQKAENVPKPRLQVPKNLRKSFLTRMCESGVNEPTLRDLARWDKQSTQARHYIEMSGKVVRDAVRKEFRGEAPEQDRKIRCSQCDTENPRDRAECIRCQTPINVASKAQLDRKRKIADTVLSKYSEEELEMIEQNVEMMNNPDKMREEMEKVAQAAARQALEQEQRSDLDIGSDLGEHSSVRRR